MFIPQCMCGDQGDNFVNSFFSFHFHLYVVFFISVALIKYLNKKQLQKENIYLVAVPSYSSSFWESQGRDSNSQSYNILSQDNKHPCLHLPATCLLFCLLSVSFLLSFTVWDSTEGIGDACHRLGLFLKVNTQSSPPQTSPQTKLIQIISC